MSRRRRRFARSIAFRKRMEQLMLTQNAEPSFILVAMMTAATLLNCPEYRCVPGSTQ